MLGWIFFNVIVMRFLRDGVIVDFEIVELMLKYFIRWVYEGKVLVFLRIVIGILSGVIGVERWVVIEVVV